MSGVRWGTYLGAKGTSSKLASRFRSVFLKVISKFFFLMVVCGVLLVKKHSGISLSNVRCVKFDNYLFFTTATFPLVCFCTEAPLLIDLLVKQLNLTLELSRKVSIQGVWIFYFEPAFCLRCNLVLIHWKKVHHVPCVSLSCQGHHHSLNYHSLWEQSTRYVR